MFRLSRLTDYGFVLLAHLAREGTGVPHNARELADHLDLPAPAVSKILKLLARDGLLESQRGSKGGYQLTRDPKSLSVAEMIGVLEGPVALTECNLAGEICQHEGNCAVRGPLHVINGAVNEALRRVTLADLIDPCFQARVSPLAVLDRPALPRDPGLAPESNAATDTKEPAPHG